MSQFTYLRTVLICDGTSDAALEHPFRWLLRRHGFQGHLDFHVAPPNSDSSHQIEPRIRLVIQQWKPDVLLIHRDGESQGFDKRFQEIEAAFINLPKERWIPVIPVRMLETWLLFDAQAIRIAAGNPNGKVDLALPTNLNRLETIVDPKRKLFDALKTASELSGRRLQKFVPHRHRHLVAEEIADFSPLLSLPAFGDLSKHVQKLVETTLPVES
jgi:hypothetical protein